MRHLFAPVALAALALAGCAAAPAASRAAAAAAYDLSGTEPFWALSVRGQRLVLSRPEIADLIIAAAAERRSDGALVWRGRTTDGRTLTATARPAACSDGMSDIRYPMSAEVSLSGETVLRGCARPAEAD